MDFLVQKSVFEKANNRIMASLIFYDILYYNNVVKSIKFNFFPHDQLFTVFLRILRLTGKFVCHYITNLHQLSLLLPFSSYIGFCLLRMPKKGPLRRSASLGLIIITHLAHLYVWLWNCRFSFGILNNLLDSKWGLLCPPYRYSAFFVDFHQPLVVC